MADDPGQAVGVERRCGPGELGEEPSGDVDELVGDLVDCFDLHAHARTVPDRVVSSAPRAWEHSATAPDGLTLQLAGHGHEPWLSVDDRWRPMRRARWGHSRRDDAARGVLAMITSSGDG